MHISRSILILWGSTCTSLHDLQLKKLSYLRLGCSAPVIKSLFPMSTFSSDKNNNSLIAFLFFLFFFLVFSEDVNFLTTFVRIEA